jgi:gluconate 2-dehydrogenase gamma chain
MPVIDRRQMLQMLGSAPMAAGFAWTGDEVSAAHGLVQAARGAGSAPYLPKFFTAHEYATVRLLVDLIIPRDEGSGSATEAGVPEFLDFLMLDEPRLAHESGRQTAMRGGLAWIDLECLRRFDKTLVACSDAEKIAVLDDISRPPPEVEDRGPETRDWGPGGLAASDTPAVPVLSHGRAFFSSFRDLTATGFWTTKMGMADLHYMGNRVVATWDGCPADALKKLGVSYE